MKRLIFLLFLLSAHASCSDLSTITSNYINEINQLKKAIGEAEIQLIYDKAREYAKILLGLVPNVQIKTLDRINAFCDLLNLKLKDLEKNVDSENKNISLKAKRDIENFKEISKFLICCSKLLDSIYLNQDIVDLMLRKIPQFIPAIGKEITVMLQVLELLISSEDFFDKVIEKMREFASQFPDGTYLMSPLLSAAMEKVEFLDYKELLKNINLSNLSFCKYLKIR
ncbi:MAG: hypothetical protein LBI95_00995 [Holosporales bacterium]|jgi:hypothetical protein|nr:hypothetical protein [Holosporales bacterium]